MLNNLLIDIGGIFKSLGGSLGVMHGTWQNYAMLAVSILLMYLAIVKKFEPLLLLPIAFGMFLINLPGAYSVVWGTYPEAVEITSAEQLTKYIIAENYPQLRFEGGIWQYLSSENVWCKLTQTVFETGELKSLADIFKFNENGELVLKSLDLFKVESLETVKKLFDEGVDIFRLQDGVWQYALISNPKETDWIVLTSSALTEARIQEYQEYFNFTANGATLKVFLDNEQTLFNLQLLNINSIWEALGLSAEFSTNAQGSIIYEAAHTYENVQNRGLLWYLFYGVQNVIYPPLIFLGIGAMTDFGPLISNPKSMILGAAAQLGVFLTLIAATLIGFNLAGAASIAIIGGADGPTAIYVTQKLSQYAQFNNESRDLLSAIAVAAYSYMALIPIIQKPLMRLIVPKKERLIKMKPLRKVSKVEKIIFPVMVTLVVGLLLPDAVPLLGMLMLGNLLKESGVCDRLSSQAQNGLMNTITIFLGVSVGCKAYGATFLQWSTLGIIGLGLVAFSFGTIGGLLVGRLMCKLSKGKINPLIGSAGVSAVPMAARISEDVGREEDPNNHLLMHAMGPNVAGVIGSAIAAGFLLAII